MARLRKATIPQLQDFALVLRRHDKPVTPGVYVWHRDYGDWRFIEVLRGETLREAGRYFGPLPETEGRE